MTIPKVRGAYGDCYELFEEAMNDPNGVRVRVASLGDCTFLRMRMHMARSIVRKESKEIYAPGDPLWGTSAWDCLVVKIKEGGGRYYMYVEKVGMNSMEVEPLSEVTEVLEPPHRPQIDIQPVIPLMIEHIRRRV